MPEPPVSLTQDLTFEGEEFRFRGQSWLSVTAWRIVIRLLETPLGSNARRFMILDLEDTLEPLENDEYKVKIASIANEGKTWDPSKHNGISWEVHSQRGCYRALRHLMHDRDLDGPTSLGDEEDLL